MPKTPIRKKIMYSKNAEHMVIKNIDSMFKLQTFRYNYLIMNKNNDIKQKKNYGILDLIVDNSIVFVVLGAVGLLFSFILPAIKF